MLIPAVSHYNWERVRGLSVFAMATDEIDPMELSFDDRLGTLLNVEDGWSQRIENVRGDDREHYHTSFPNGKKIRLRFTEPRQHRPEISDDTAQELAVMVAKDYPGVPVESLNFDRQLGLLLDNVQEYYELVGCELVGAK